MGRSKTCAARLRVGRDFLYKMPRRCTLGIDVLSDVLSTVRLRGAVFFDVTCKSPWVEETPHGAEIVHSLLPGVEHLIPYHVVSRGGCWAGVTGDEPVRLAAGDIIVFPHGDAHVMSSAPGMRLQQPKDRSVYAHPPDVQLPLQVQVGGEGDATVLVCGYLGCDASPFNPLVAALPRRLVISDSDGGRPGWLTGFAEVALAESRGKRAGGESILSRLSELMFVEVLRRYLERLGQEQTGWLAGLRDPHTGRALSLLHERPGHAWTIEDLAREVGLSRSALAERFTQLVGQPPMQYLAQWRMQVAAGMLAGGSKVIEAALEVGYDSEASFSRAFKRLVGLPPAVWRDRRSQAAPAVPTS
jgi:AraC-like DNA-binding protein